MTLERRLQDLVAERNHEQAVTLAKAAMKNEVVVDVVVDDEAVFVETPRFRGVHRWWTDPEGRVRLGGRGTYHCTCDGVDLAFSTMRIHPAAHDRAIERLRERTAADSGTDAAGADPDGSSGTDPADAPRSARPADAARSDDAGDAAVGTGRPDALREATAGPGDAGPSDSVPDDRKPLADGGTAGGGDRSRTSWWSRILRGIAALFP